MNEVLNGNFLAKSSRSDFTTDQIYSDKKQIVIADQDNDANSIDGLWFYNRCAINYANKNFYVVTSHNSHVKTRQFIANNGVDGYISKTLAQADWIGQYTTGNTVNDTYFSHIYWPSDTITLKILNAKDVGTHFYIRNLYIFNEFLPLSLLKIQY